MPHLMTWKSDTDENRLNLYVQNTFLYKGWYEKVWKELKPPDPEFKTIVMNDAANITDAIANLLFREEPDYKAETVPSSQPEIDRIVRATNFNATLKEQGTWGSVLGDMVFLIRHDGTEVKIDFVHPKFFFGQFAPFDTNELMRATLQYPITSDSGRVKFLYRQVHDKGIISNQLWRVQGNEVTEPLPLTDRPETALLLPTIETGVDALLVVHAKNRNFPGEPYGQGDYSHSLKTKFRARTALMTQFDSVRAKHSNPKLALPQTLLESLRDSETGQILVDRDELDMIGLQEGEEVKFVTWDGELNVSLKEDDVLLTQILDEAKISPALLGKSEAGIAGGETGRANTMKILASLGLAHSKQQLLEPAIRDVLFRAQLLENTIDGAARYEASEVKVIFADGLPADSLNNSQIMNIRILNGTMSRQEAIIRQDGVTEAEALRIMEEAAKEGVFIQEVTSGNVEPAPVPIETEE